MTPLSNVCMSMSILLSLLSIENAIFLEDTKLTASDAESFDSFGHTVAISNNYFVIGAYGDDTGGSNAGSVYVYEQDTINKNKWTEIQKLVASDGQSMDYFGKSVAASNDYTVIGAKFDSTVSYRAGSAYVFKRNNTNRQWSEIQKLQASDANIHDWFGSSVTISDNNEYIIIGTTGDSSVYIYKLNNNGLFDEIQKLQASDKESGDLFGVTVAISNESIVIGASDKDVRSNTNAGCVYVFELNNTNGLFYETQKLHAINAQSNDKFGFSLSILNDYIIVGTPYKDTVGTNSGSVYIFERDIDTNSWNQTQKLQSSDIESDDLFGYSVDISNDYIIIGTWNAQYVYVYQRDTHGIWSEIEKLTSLNTITTDHFGESVSISDTGNIILIGASYANIGGATYVFRNYSSINPTLNPTSNPTTAPTTVAYANAIQDIKLKASDAEADDRFGDSVAISYNYMVIGAYGDDNQAGSAYVYKRDN
eukprot:298663_1